MMKISLFLNAHLFAFSKSNDDLEHLLSISTSEDSRPNLTKSYTNSSNNSTSYQYSIASDIDKKELINESWYQPNLPRDNVHSCLADKEIGSFIIRLSNTCKNCYALSIRVPYFANQNGIAHYLITKNSRGFKLKGVEKEFKSLKSLVTHYSVMQEILPVTLNSMGLIALSHTSNSNDNHNLHALTEKNTNMACIY